MPKLYPMTFTPILKHYLWGGRRLANINRDLPSNDKVAESWEIAAHQDGITLVENGIFAKKSLDEIMACLGTDLVGSNNQWALDLEKFPLLIKLLDANQRLSVQVHPDDSFAQKYEHNELGKSEMWVVLWADEGAEIIYGFSHETTPKKFEQAIRDGNIERYLHRIAVKAGDHICVPPGTLHAILEGILIAEIQQNSNTTYRVFDWNRTDPQGNHRALHIEQALQVINFSQVKTPLSLPMPLSLTDDIKHESLCDNRYFTTERLSMRQGSLYNGCCDGSTLEIWGVIKGSAHISKELATEIQFYLLPAAMGDFAIQAASDCVLLRTYTKAE